MNTTQTNDIKQLIGLGEGQTVEFKESVARLDREIVGFANASGGTIFCGVSDAGDVVGVSVTNRLISEVQDIGRNCDPPISLSIEVIEIDTRKVLAVRVPEGERKPYQCSGGFYSRIGANCQKLKSEEVRGLMASRQSFFDSKVNGLADYQRDYSATAIDRFAKLVGVKAPFESAVVLDNLGGIVVQKDHSIRCTNAGVLLFTDLPKRFLPESYITAVRYAGVDKFSVIDRQEFSADVVGQIEGALGFVKRHISVSYEISETARRVEYYEYPLAAVREALINAVVHRDYAFQGSCIYLSIFRDRLEIENPGGIFQGLGVDEIEGRSVRRNPLLADLLFRAGYGEKLGSGLTRIRTELERNGNPPWVFSSAAFFALRFYPRVAAVLRGRFTPRQSAIVSLLSRAAIPLSSSEIATEMQVSVTTITRDLSKLKAAGVVTGVGEGRAIRYCSAESALVK